MPLTLIELTTKDSPMVCIFCQTDDHWNHQGARQAQPSRGPVPVGVGECRAYETISGQRCACEYRPEPDDPR